MPLLPLLDINTVNMRFPGMAVFLKTCLFTVSDCRFSATFLVSYI